MIDEDATFEQFGYKSTDLTPRSGKKIIAVCDECEKVRIIPKDGYHDLCFQCACRTKERRKKLSEATLNMSDETRKKMSEVQKGKTHSKETRKKMSEARTGEKNHFYGKTHSEESQKKMSEAASNRSEETLKKMSEAHRGKTLSEEHRKNISKANKGKTHSEETRKKIAEASANISEETRKKRSEATLNMSDETREKMSAAKQGIPYEAWEGFATESPYCPKFNEVCRESNREKYDRRCFICGKHESENITKAGKQQRLSVHHVDMDKMQGCDGHRWKLIPTCIKHHGSVHTHVWQSRIEYLLQDKYPKLI